MSFGAIPGGVGWTYSPDLVFDAAWNSLVVYGYGYVRHREGFLFIGDRPGPDWYGHGYFGRWMWVLVAGEPVRIRLRKHRWRRKGANETCHSRPPGEVGSRKVCMLLLVLLIWQWLDGDRGIHDAREKHAEFLSVVSKRTVQRYLHWLQPQGLTLQQFIREAVIERSEPRPVERLFPGGLPPPGRLRRHGWTDHENVIQLWTGLALAFGAAIKLETPAAVLLAEARGRYAQNRDPIPM